MRAQERLTPEAPASERSRYGPIPSTRHRAKRPLPFTSIGALHRPLMYHSLSLLSLCNNHKTVRVPSQSPL